jgi:hypothetical protein
MVKQIPFMPGIHPLPDGSQPTEWFHDIFKKDGSPYREDEVNLIRKLNEVK